MPTSTTIWAPIYKKDAIQIENVQQRATRFVPNLKTLSYPERLKTLGHPSLEYRRDRADMIQVYKILNGIDKVDKDLLFTMSNNPTRGHPQKSLRNGILSVLEDIFLVTESSMDGTEVVTAPSLNSSKSRLNKCWKVHTYKFEP